MIFEIFLVFSILANFSKNEKILEKKQKIEKEPIDLVVNSDKNVEYIQDGEEEERMETEERGLNCAELIEKNLKSDPKKNGKGSEEEFKINKEFNEWLKKGGEEVKPKNVMFPSQKESFVV